MHPSQRIHQQAHEPEVGKKDQSREATMHVEKPGHRFNPGSAHCLSLTLLYKVGHLPNLRTHDHLQHGHGEHNIKPFFKTWIYCRYRLCGHHLPSGLSQREKQGRNDCQCHQHMQGNHAGLQVRTHHPGTQPALKANHKKRRNRSFRYQSVVMP